MATNPNLQVTSTSVNNITDVVKELVLKYDGLSAQVSSLMNAIGGGEETNVTKLINKVNELTNKVNTLTSNINSLDRNSLATKRDVANVSSSTQTQISELRNAIERSTANQNNAATNAVLESLNGQIRTLTSRIETFEGDFEDHKNNVQDSVRNIMSSYPSSSDIKAAITKTNSNATRISTIANSISDYETQKNKITSIDVELNEAKAEYRNLANSKVSKEEYRNLVNIVNLKADDSEVTEAFRELENSFNAESTNNDRLEDYSEHLYNNIRYKIEVLSKMLSFVFDKLMDDESEYWQEKSVEIQKSILKGYYDEELDVNGDGEVDINDLSRWIDAMIAEGVNEMVYFKNILDLLETSNGINYSRTSVEGMFSYWYPAKYGENNSGIYSYVYDPSIYEHIMGQNATYYTPANWLDDKVDMLYGSFEELLNNFEQRYDLQSNEWSRLESLVDEHWSALNTLIRNVDNLRSLFNDYKRISDNARRSLQTSLEAAEAKIRAAQSSADDNLQAIQGVQTAAHDINYYLGNPSKNSTLEQDIDEKIDNKVKELDSSAGALWAQLYNLEDLDEMEDNAMTYVRAMYSNLWLPKEYGDIWTDSAYLDETNHFDWTKFNLIGIPNDDPRMKVWTAYNTYINNANAIQNINKEICITRNGVLTDTLKHEYYGSFFYAQFTRGLNKYGYQMPAAKIPVDGFSYMFDGRPYDSSDSSLPYDYLLNEGFNKGVVGSSATSIAASAARKAIVDANLNPDAVDDDPQGGAQQGGQA